MPKLFHGLTENIKKSWMMSENIFPKIKLFLKERLKQFTGLYLGPKIVMKKTNKSNQDKNKTVRWHRQKTVFNVFHLCWLICKFIISGNTRVFFSVGEKEASVVHLLLSPQTTRVRPLCERKERKGKEEEMKRKNSSSMISVFPWSHSEPSQNKLQVPWPNPAAAQQNWWVPRSLATRGLAIRGAITHPENTQSLQ